MPKKIYKVILTNSERLELETIVLKGKVDSITKRAQVLLKAGNGWGDGDIIKAVDVSRSTVERTRRRFVEEGLECALQGSRLAP